jgi:DNA adenine methylase
VIRDHDRKDTLFYLDPPYLHRTRTARRTYRYEMNDEAHAELIDAVLPCRGLIILSGSPDTVYNERLRGWKHITFAIPNLSEQGKTKQRLIEVLWINLHCLKRSPTLQGQEIQSELQG